MKREHFAKSRCDAKDVMVERAMLCAKNEGSL